MSLFANAKSALLSDSSTTSTSNENQQSSGLLMGGGGGSGGLFLNQPQNAQPSSIFGNVQSSHPRATLAGPGLSSQNQQTSVFTSNSHITSAFPAQPSTSASGGGGLFGNQSASTGGGGGLFSGGTGTGGGGGLFSNQSASTGGGGGLFSGGTGSTSGGLLGSTGGGLLSGGGGLLGSQGMGGGLQLGSTGGSLLGSTGGGLLSGGGGLLGSQGTGGGLLGSLMGPGGQQTGSGMMGSQGTGGGLLGSQPAGGLGLLAHPAFGGAATGGSLLSSQTLMGGGGGGGLLGVQPANPTQGGGGLSGLIQPSTSQGTSNGPSSTNPPGIGTFDHIGRVHVYRDQARDWAVASITGAIPNQGLEELRVRDYLALKRGQVNPDRVREVEQIREQNRRARDSGFIPPPANTIPPGQNVTPPSSNNTGGGASAMFGTTSAPSQGNTSSGIFGSAQPSPNTLLANQNSLLPGEDSFSSLVRQMGGQSTSFGGQQLPPFPANSATSNGSITQHGLGGTFPAPGIITGSFGAGGNQVPGGMRLQHGAPQMVQAGMPGMPGMPTHMNPQQMGFVGAPMRPGQLIGGPGGLPGSGGPGSQGIPTATAFGTQQIPKQLPQQAQMHFAQRGTYPPAPQTSVGQLHQFGAAAPAQKKAAPKRTQVASQNVNTTSSQFYYEINRMLFVSGFVDLLSKHNLSAPENLLDETDFTARFVEFLEGYNISLPREGIPKFQVEVAKQTSQGATEVVRRPVKVAESDSEEEKVELAKEEEPRKRSAKESVKAKAAKKGKAKKVVESSNSSESEEEVKPQPKRRASVSKRSKSPRRKESVKSGRSKSRSRSRSGSRKGGNRPIRRQSRSKSRSRSKGPVAEQRRSSLARRSSSGSKKASSRRKSVRRSSGTLTNQELNALDGLATEKTEESQETETTGITTTF